MVQVEGPQLAREQLLKEHKLELLARMCIGGGSVYDYVYYCTGCSCVAAVGRRRMEYGLEKWPSFLITREKHVCIHGQCCELRFLPALESGECVVSALVFGTRVLIQIKSDACSRLGHGFLA